MVGRTLDIRRRKDETTSRKLGDVFFKRGVDEHVAVHAVLCRPGSWVCVDRHLSVRHGEGVEV